MAAAEQRCAASVCTARRDSVSASGIAAAMAATSPVGTSRPPAGSTISGMPPRAKATTGVPHIMASATTNPYGSSHCGVTNAAAEAPTR